MTRIPAQQPAVSQWVVIVADDAALGREIVESWQTERRVPDFTSMTTDLWEHASAIWQRAAIDDYDLAIFANVSPDKFASALGRVASDTPAIAVLHDGISPKQVRFEHPNVIPLRQAENVIETAVIAGAELLYRRLCQRKLVEAEAAMRHAQSQAGLGRFMLEARHNFNNALTGVLGSAELMQMADLQPIEEAREQVKTIHMMALRLQALMQRFSALEAEMKMSERSTRRADVLEFAARGERP